MSWLYSQALVEEYSQDISLDGAQCALWNGTPTQPASWLPAKTTKRSQLSRSGTTFKLLTEDLGKDVLMSFLEDFPVKTFPALEKEQESKASEVVCGDTWQELSVKLNQSLPSSKTVQCSSQEDSQQFSQTLPRWGMMRNGVLWERTTSVPLTSVTGSGLWPTPQANEDAAGTPNGKMQRMLGNHPLIRGTTKEEWAAGTLNPNWVEWLMGFPIGWTDLEVLAMPKFQQWQHLHGKS